MGRPRKPTKQLERAGAFAKNPQRRRPAEPVADVNEPVCPESLDEFGRDEWLRVTDQLRVLGILSASDSAALEIYCQTFSEWRDMVSRGKSGLKYVATLRQLLCQFGLTPASRSAINIERASDSSQDPFLKIARIRDGAS